MSDDEKKDQSEMSMEEILASIRKIIAEDQEGAAQQDGAGGEDEDVEPAGFGADIEEDFEESDDDILDLSESDIEEDDVLELAEDEVVPVAEEEPSPAAEPHHEEVAVEDSAEPEESDEADISPPPMPEETVERTYSSGPPVVEEEEAELPEPPEPEEKEMADEFKPGTQPEGPVAGLGEGPDVEQAEELAAARRDEDQESILSPAAASATSAAFDELERSIAARQTPAGGDMVEDLTRELIKPLLREWMDANLPRIVDEIVTREIKRIIGER